MSTSISATSALASAQRALEARPLSLIIEPAGAHKFAYTKIASDTGEAVWRWPNEPAMTSKVESKGQLLDLVA